MCLNDIYTSVPNNNLSLNSLVIIKVEDYNNTNCLTSGYVLSDAGFDVWLYNCRGAGLSRTLSIYKGPGSLPNMNRISWDFR